MMAFSTEHPKWDQNPKFTPLSETTSIPTLSYAESPPPPPGYKLDPPVDYDGVIRVGDRISREDTTGDLKHPVIIPRKGHLTELLIQHHHLKVDHMVEA